MWVTFELSLQPFVMLTLASADALQSSSCKHRCSYPRSGYSHKTCLYLLQLDKKRLELERFREQKKRMEDDLKRLDNLAEQQESEFARMANDFQGVNFSPGYQSEPATPPEYRDPSFTSVYTNRNRFSSASLTSPMGLNNRLSLSGSQITSPPPEPAQQNGSDSDKLPSKSVPASRRGSSDKFAQYIPDTGIIGQRSTVMYVAYHVQFLNSYLHLYCGPLLSVA